MYTHKHTYAYGIYMFLNKAFKMGFFCAAMLESVK